MKRFIKRYRMGVAIFSTALVSFLGYGFVEDYFEVSKNLDIFSTLYREVNMYYVDPTDPGKLMKKGIDAMLETLDPYTNFIPESESRTTVHDHGSVRRHWRPHTAARATTCRSAIPTKDTPPRKRTSVPAMSCSRSTARARKGRRPTK